MTNTRIIVTRPNSREVAATVRMSADADVMADALAAILPDWSFVTVVYPANTGLGERRIPGRSSLKAPADSALPAGDAMINVIAVADETWLQTELDRVRQIVRVDGPTQYRMQMIAVLQNTLLIAIDA